MLVCTCTQLCLFVIELFLFGVQKNNVLPLCHSFILLAVQLQDDAFYNLVREIRTYVSQSIGPLSLSERTKTF